MTPLHPSIRLGCTFTPEKHPDQDNLVRGFRFVVEDMGLRKIRFALRWNKILGPDGSLSLEYYMGILQAMSQYENLELCLNVGPLKTTAWPEFHVPEQIVQSASQLPVWPRELPFNHDLVKTAGEYLHQLLRLIKRDFPSKVLDSITAFQLDNEGFNPFGQPLVVMSIDTELYFYSILAHYFPHPKILFNSAGKLQVRKILQIQSKLDSASVLGLDYYYHTPTNDYPWIRNFNQLNLPLPWLPRMSRIKGIMEQTGRELEFTEVQMEKWGHIEYPASSPEALVKVLNFLVRYKPRHQSKILMRLWGVESFADAFLKGEQSEGMEEMLRIIRE